MKEELRHIVQGEIADSEDTLQAYSRDWSIFQVRPQCVVFPRDVEDIKRLVSFATEHASQGVSLTCRSGGSDMTGGPLSESIVLDFPRHFNRIREIGEKHVVAEPGVFYRDLEKELTQRNLLLPSYPASKELCALGGMIANNSGGEKTLIYGKTEQYVQELRVVFSDGNEYIVKPLSAEELAEKMALETFEGSLYRRLHALIEAHYDLLQEAKPKVSKNSAGYFLWNVWDRKTFDLTKLLVGSQGTLGVVTRATLRLVPLQKYSSLLVIFLRDMRQLGQIIQKVLEKKPESFESYDDHTLKVALQFLPDIFKLLGTKNFFSLGMQFLPEVAMMLSGGLPRLVLLAEFCEDSFAQAQLLANETRESLRAFHVPLHVTKTQDEQKKYFTIRRESFRLLHSHVKGMSAAAFIDDLIVQPQYLSEFLPRLEKLLHPYRNHMVYTVAGHVGDGNFHIIPLVNMKNPNIKTIIPELMEKVHDLVFEFHGSFTAEHNDGIIRTPFLQDMYGEKVYGLFRETKRIFDPLNIFNPGKKVAGTLLYALQHMIS